MTGPELALLLFPTAGLVMGGLVYWLATRPEKPKGHHPAE